MLEKSPISDLSEGQILARAEICAHSIQRGEVELLEIAYGWALAHDRNRLDPAEAEKPGREKARMFGGPGTFEVAEFASAALGARIERSTYAAAQLIADAQDLHHRLPELWGRVMAGEVRASYARHVCARTRELSETEAGYVDAEVAESADGRITWSRFEVLVEAKVKAAAPTLARQKEEQAAKARFAKRLGGEAHGMASFMIRADVGTIKLIDETVTALAAKLTGLFPDDPSDPDINDDRRIHALRLLMKPGTDHTTALETQLADVMPEVTLVVHVQGDGGQTVDDDGQVNDVVRVEGHGPMTTTWLRETLGPTAKFVVRPVFDPLGQAPVDAYEIPARHRTAVGLMSPADCFPWGSSTSPTMQIDHNIPYDAGGPSAIGNYGPMTTQHHRIKTHGGWQVQQPFPGIYCWRDPYGGFYVVDHTGTRRIPSAPTEPNERAAPVVVHLHHTDIDLRWAA